MVHFILKIWQLVAAGGKDFNDLVFNLIVEN